MQKVNLSPKDFKPIVEGISKFWGKYLGKSPKCPDERIWEVEFIEDIDKIN